MVLLGFIYKTQTPNSNDRGFKGGNSKALDQILGRSDHGVLYADTGYIVSR